jgi:hypothetical protein
MAEVQMPLSIAERLHQLPRGAQAAVAEKCAKSTTTVSAIMRGVYPRPESEGGKQSVRRVQEALAARFVPPLPVWEVFAEWDGERPAQEATPALAARAG